METREKLEGTGENWRENCWTGFANPHPPKRMKWNKKTLKVLGGDCGLGACPIPVTLVRVRVPFLREKWWGGTQWLVGGKTGTVGSGWAITPPPVDDSSPRPEPSLLSARGPPFCRLPFPFLSAGGSRNAPLLPCRSFDPNPRGDLLRCGSGEREGVGGNSWGSFSSGLSDKMFGKSMGNSVSEKFVSSKASRVGSDSAIGLFRGLARVRLAIKQGGG